MRKILCNVRFIAGFILLILFTCIFSLIIGIFFADRSTSIIYNEDLNSSLQLYNSDDNNSEVKLWPITHYVHDFRCGSDDVIKFNKYYMDYIFNISKTTIDQDH